MAVGRALLLGCHYQVRQFSYNAEAYPTCDLQGACAKGQGANAMQRVSTVKCCWRISRNIKWRKYEREVYLL